MARSSRGGGGPIRSDDFTGFSLIMIVVGLCILGWASWQLWHAEISRIALVAAHYEMQAIGVVTDRFRPADLAVQRAHFGRVQFDQLVRLYRNIGEALLYPAMALILALAISCFLRAGNNRFTRTFDLEKLMAEQAIVSRSTAAFVGRGLKLSELRAGEPRPAGAALDVDEWIARYATSETSGFDEAAAPRGGLRPSREGGEGGFRGGGAPPRVHAPVRRAVDGACRGFARGALNARGLRPAGRPAPRRNDRAARTPVGRVAAQQSRRRRRTRRAARLRSEDARPRRSRACNGGGRSLCPRSDAEASFHHARPHVGPERSALKERPYGAGAVRLLEAGRSPPLVRAACARIRIGRAHCSSPSEHAGRGDRRGRPLGGRACGRRADPDTGVRSGDRRDPHEGGLNESRSRSRRSSGCWFSSRPVSRRRAAIMDKGDKTCWSRIGQAWKRCSTSATLPGFGSTFGSIRRGADRLAPRRARSSG